MTNRTFYHTLYNKTAVLKITSQMFDINFYEAVTRFVDLNDKIKQNPKELIPSKASCGRSNVYTKFSENIKKYEHTLHHKLAFKY